MWEDHPDLMAVLLNRVARGEGLSDEQLEALKQDAQFCATAEALEAVNWNEARSLGEQIELFQRTRRIPPRCLLEVDGRVVQTLVEPAELWRFYLPLCRMLRARARDAAGARFVVGVTGPPGGGKSVFAAMLQRLLTTAEQSLEPMSVVVGLDGFHHTNDYLDANFRSVPGLTPEPLRAIKGAPETFDVQAFVSALDRFRTEPELELPAYDRRVHDPVPGAIRVQAAYRLGLVEGNYLLLDEKGWEAVQSRLDLRIFVSIPLEAIRPHIIERHMRGGRDARDAERHFERVDRRNYEVCTTTMRRADLIVVRGPDQHIKSVRTPKR